MKASLRVFTIIHSTYTAYTNSKKCLTNASTTDHAIITPPLLNARGDAYSMHSRAARVAISMPFVAHAFHEGVRYAGLWRTPHAWAGHASPGNPYAHFAGWGVNSSVSDRKTKRSERRESKLHAISINDIYAAAHRGARMPHVRPCTVQYLIHYNISAGGDMI